MMLSEDFIDKMREVIAWYDRGREIVPTSSQGYGDSPTQSALVEVRIIEAPGTGTGTGSGSGSYTHDEGELYLGNITWNDYGTHYTDGMEVYIKPNNPSDTFTVGKRYPARISHAAEDGGFICIGYAQGASGGGSLTVTEDGSTSYDSITTLWFYTSDFFFIQTDVDFPNTAFVRMSEAAYPSTGGTVNEHNQIFPGIKGAEGFRFIDIANDDQTVFTQMSYENLADPMAESESTFTTRCYTSSGGGDLAITTLVYGFNADLTTYVTFALKGGDVDGAFTDDTYFSIYHQGDWYKGQSGTGAGGDEFQGGILYEFYANKMKRVSVPGSSSATGAVGDIAFDSSYIYVCHATNTWKRVALSTF
jgi:hypothetical protein